MKERRKDRCEVRPEAIAKQLEAVIRSENLDMLVVAGDQGDLVAKNESATKEGAGELALLGMDALRFRNQMGAHLDVDDSIGLTIRRPQLRGLAVRYLNFHGNPLAIVARSRNPLIDPDSLDRAVAGVARILEAEDIRREIAGSNRG